MRTMPLRRRAIATLELRPGDAVLDAGCGTGLSFPIIEMAIGRGGRITGIELSPDMARLARERIAGHGWINASVLETRIEDAALDGPYDAILFNFAHDILQSPRALERVFDAARPGARVAAAGSKLLPWWLLPVNAYVRRINAPYMTTFAGLDQPWRGLSAYVPDLAVAPALWGAAYIAHGHYRLRSSSTGPNPGRAPSLER